MSHQCYLCDPENPHRVVTYSDSDVTVSFPSRFVGPPKRAHGGVSVASLMCPALAAAEHAGYASPLVRMVSGRLHVPVPLNRAFAPHVHLDGGGCEIDLKDGEQTVVSGRVELEDRPATTGEPIQPIPASLKEPLSVLTAMAGADLDGPTMSERFTANCLAAGYQHPANICFGCGETPDVLQLFNREAGDGNLWTRWATEPGFVDEPGRLAASMAVAALDCSNLWILVRDDPSCREPGVKIYITGSFTVHFLRVAPLEVPGGYRVLTKTLGIEGRKGFTMAALMDERGETYAVAESLAILIDTPEEMILRRA